MGQRRTGRRQRALDLPERVSGMRTAGIARVNFADPTGNSAPFIMVATCNCLLPDG